MAKSKKSRRARRQEAAKQKQTDVSPAVKDETEPAVEEEAAPSEIVEETSLPRSVVNFAREYFYVYTELRSILIVAIIMFIVMAGLAYFV